MTFADQINQGVRCLLDGGFTEIAVWVLDKILVDFPENAQAHHERALIAYHQGDVHQAGLHFQRAVEFAPNNPLFLKSLGDFCHVAHHRTGEAIDWYKKVLELNPDDVQTILTLAHLLVSLSCFGEAAEYYRSALRIEPGNGEIRPILDKLTTLEGQGRGAEESKEDLYENACRMIAEGNSQDAVSALKKVIAADNNHALAHNDLGVLRLEVGDMDAALKHYRKAAELDPENVTFQKNLADFYWMEQNDAQAAMQKYVQVLKLDPQDVEALLGCAQICLSVGRKDDARDFIDCALELEPWNSDARQLAKQLEEIVMKADTPFDSDALYLEAQNKAANGDFTGAIDDLNRVLDHSPDNAVAYNDLGVLYYETGDKEKSLSCYQQAYELAPEQPNIIKNLADFYLMEKDRPEEAMQLYVKVLEKTPEDVECLMATALVCALVEKPEDAADFYRRVIAIEPWNQEAVQALGKLKKKTSSDPDGVEIKRAIG